jgi:S-DNA-T family DNA segregation ATPase FtsK/SpoIIIE
VATQIEPQPLAARLTRQAWWFRHEIAATLLVVATLGGVFAIPQTRRLTTGWYRRSRTRRQLVHAFAATRMANPVGKLPRVWRVRITPFGERVEIRTRPGHSAELFDMRMEEFRAATKAATVRIIRDRSRSNRVVIDVVRRDPLAAAAVVDWEGTTGSLWDQVHVGRDEMAAAVRILLMERSVLIGGQPGSGKSSLMQALVAHAASSPAHLALIDPNEVQLSPWRDRAWLYSGPDPDDAIGVLRRVQAELDRRLAVLKRLAGVNRKIDQAIAAEHGMHPILLAIDEFAHATSVAGTRRQQEEFTATMRDIVSRGRAVLIIVVAATQRPTQDVVPRAISDLFAVRVAFRTSTAGNSDVILGDGWAKKGFSAADIDLGARGVGILRGDGADPVRFKAAWISDTDVGRHSRASIAHMPDAPPTAPDRPALATAAA